jgi:hypothetical protein
VADDGKVTLSLAIDKAKAALDELKNHFVVTFGDISRFISGAFDKIAAFFRGAVDQAAEAQTALAEVNRLIKSTGGAAKLTAEELKGTAEELAKISAYDDDEILSKVTATLLRFGTLSGETFKRAQADAVDLAATLKIDLASAAELAGKALLTPGENLRLLKQAGVDFTESETKALQAMVETGRAAEAQAAILDRLERATNGAAKAFRETLAGALAELKVQVGELQQAFGEGFSKELAGNAEELNKTLEQLKPTLRDLGEAFGVVLEFLAKITKELPLAKVGFDDLEAKVTSFAAVVLEAVATIEEQFSKLKGVPFLHDAAQAAEDAAGSLRGNLIPALKAASAEFAQSAEQGALRWKAAQEGIEGTGKAAKEAGESAKSIPSALDEIPEKAAKAGAAIQEHLTSAAKSAAQSTGAADGSVSTNATTDALRQQQQALQGTVDALKAKQQQGLTTIEDENALFEAENKLADVSRDLHNAQLDTASSLQSLGDAAAKAVDPIEQGAKLLQQMRDAGLALPAPLDEAGKGIGVIGDASKATKEELSNLDDATKALSDGMAEAVGPVGHLDEAIQGFAERGIKATEAGDDLNKTLGKTADESERIAKAGPADAIAELADAAKKAKGPLEELLTLSKEIRDVWKDIVALVHEEQRAA